MRQLETETRSTMTKLEWGVLFSVIASAASIVFSAGVIWTTVKVHDSRIAQLETTANSNNDRLARIETKLDVILADRTEGGRR
ncbi:MAG: hypothetical protein KGM49_00680 [Sphingomonadales bacterium]|nr:hypothetical protein [Sphingomonadales bacterium]